MNQRTGPRLTKAGSITLGEAGDSDKLVIGIYDKEEGHLIDLTAGQITQLRDKLSSWLKNHHRNGSEEAALSLTAHNISDWRYSLNGIVEYEILSPSECEELREAVDKGASFSAYQLGSALYTIAALRAVQGTK